MRILCIEDNTLDADLARRALEAAQPGHQVLVVGSVAQARESLEDAAGWDVVLADLSLPDGSGLDVLAHARSLGLSVAVVILTGSGDQDSAVAALKAGADDYIVKRGDYLRRLAGLLDAALARYRAQAWRRSRRLRVLYVEPNAFDADLTRRYLAQWAPHILLETRTDAQPLLDALAASAAPEWDVLLLDYMLPGLNALEVVKILRDELGVDLPVVMVTGQGTEEIAVHALHLGVHEYVVKNADYLHQLPSVIESAFHRAELERREAALTRTTQRLGHLLASNPTILFALRPQGEDLVAVWVSDSLTRVLGYSVEEALEPGWWARHVHAEDYARVMGETSRLFEQDRLTHDYRFLHKDGSTRWVRDELRVVRDAEGHVAEIVGSWNDITEQRRAEVKLRLDASAFASTRDGVMVVGVDGNIVSVNPAFCAITGYSAEEVAGKSPRLLKSGRQDLTFYRGMWASILATGSWQGELWNRRKSGDPFPAWLSVSTVRDERGAVSHYVGVMTDLSQIRSREAQLDHLAHRDTLTDLPNRLLSQSLLEHAIDRARRHQSRVAVLFIDLDRFKTVNDSLGYTAGDDLLVGVAKTIRERVRGDDAVGRMGGDEFLVIVEGVHGPEEASALAGGLLDAISVPIRLRGGREVYISASIGISLYPDDGASAAELIRDADAAMYMAKQNGRNLFCFHTADMNVSALGRLDLEAALRRAVEQREFCLHYQPKLDLRTGALTGAEALLRWPREGHGMMAPMQFIPLAERTGLITAIGEWVLDEACRQLRAWRDAGIIGLRVAVNVSARQFRTGNLETCVNDAVTRHGIAPDCLELELTESMLMERPAEAAELLRRLKRTGVRLSLDDFGTGYSSLAYLSRFPIDTLKIDRSFVQDIVTEPVAATIATSIIGLAHRMNLRVVAEGVETEAQLGYLRMNHCDEMQGYYFSKPVAPEEFARLVEAGERLAPAQSGAVAVRRVLLVDDEDSVLTALGRELRGQGYEILTATSGAQGLELMAKHAVQVVVSDQRMPGMSGTEFLSRVKTMHPNTVRIVLSGYTDVSAITGLINEGALYKFLTKPWETEQLREHLRDAFRYYEAVVRPGAPGPGPAGEAG